MGNSLDPAISDVPSDETLAEALSAATGADRDLAVDIIQALNGGDGHWQTDSFKRQLRHRLEQAYIHRSE